jgi:hypothetical protein
MAPPPIQLGIGLSLARAGGAGLDPDAAAYIAAIETAGATVSAAQKSALDTFYRTGKSEGWYSSIKRIYLPIWAVAAANARCMVSGTSGTFVPTVSHSAGYVQGDGSSGYFDPGAASNLRTLGLSNESLHFMLGIYLGGSTASVPVGVWDGVSANRCQITNELSPTSINRFACPEVLSSKTAILEDSGRNGILIGGCTAADSRYLLRRRSSGIESNLNTESSATNIPDDRAYFMARKTVSSYDLAYNGQLFAYGLGSGLPLADSGNYSLALKTLWETATGLTLP